MQFRDKKPLGLYLHIPFCASKCGYCDFFSFVPSNPEIITRYVNALTAHMKFYRGGARDRRVDTVFIGGGTPTSIGADALCEIVAAVKHNFELRPRPEFTIECNPATATFADFVKLRKAGVNRLSIGLQSADNRELIALTRRHNREQFENCYRDARRAGFENINIDLMYGIPLQTRDSFLRSVGYAISLAPEHISMYALKIEEGTPFFAARHNLTLPDDDEEYEMYMAACRLLGSRGYEHYEISNFARSGFRCEHNYKYWDCEEYLGLGASAHSYYNGSRFSFKCNIDAYMNALEIKNSNIRLTDEDYAISPRERVGEYVMLRLRLSDGIDTREFRMRFGLDFEAMFADRLAQYIKYGYVSRVPLRDGAIYALTESGMFISNRIICELVEFDENGSIFVGV